jgi:hypothetical protein
MATQSRLTAWKWTAFILGSLWAAIGCTPGTLTGLLMPFSDDKVPPVCKLAKPKQEVTVCIVTNFAALETRLDTVPAANELSELFAQQLRKRAEENKEKIKVLPPSKTRSYASAADFTGRTLQDIGKQCKADYVISLEITGLELYERRSAQMLYHGNADINIQVVDVTKPAGEGSIFIDAFRREYPKDRPLDVSDMNPSQFRLRFLNAVAGDLARMFTAYPSDQRNMID